MRNTTQPQSTPAPDVVSSISKSERNSEASTKLAASTKLCRGVVNWGTSVKDLPKVAVLVLEEYLGRAGHKRTPSFDDRRFLGLHIVLDVIRRAYGIEADYTSIKTINDYDIVLISLTSTLDVYNLVYTFERYDVKITRPLIVIGGAGVLNIRSYLRYGDYFVFGRGEVPIIDIFEHLINNAPLNNDSVFQRGVSSFDQTYTLAQVSNPYPYEVNGLRESMLGCKLKCFYCGYTYHRKPEKNWSHKFQYYDDDFWSASEMTIREVIPEIRSGSRVITSIDGSSERLRAAFNKPMTDDEYRDVITSIPHVEADSVFLKVFNICGYPTETGQERIEPLTVLLPVADELANSTTIVYQQNPFIPMALTPAQYLPADIFTDYRAWYQRLREAWTQGGQWFVETGRLRIGIGPAINTNLGLLKRCLVHRGEADTLALIKNIVFNRKLKRLRASEQVKALGQAVDLTRYFRQYEPGEPMPFDYLSTYASKKAIDNLARRLHADLGV